MSPDHAPAHELVELLTLERLEDDLFRGQSRDIGTKYVFGGQVLGQALSAAQATMDAGNGRLSHSLHAYFLRAGDIDAPIVYTVDRTRDGGSFSVRRVTAIQHGKVIFFCACSFQTEEGGAQHQAPMPEVPPPEDVPPTQISAEELAKLPPKIQRWMNRSGPFEFRRVHPRNELNPQPQAPVQKAWFRLGEKVESDSPALQRAMLAYASDFGLLGTATYPHAISYYQPGVQMASLDHAIWFHRPFRVDDWLLYSIDSPSAQSSRGLARGQIFNRAGELVASVAQEGLIRVAETKA